MRSFRFALLLWFCFFFPLHLDGPVLFLCSCVPVYPGCNKSKSIYERWRNSPKLWFHSWYTRALHFSLSTSLGAKKKKNAFTEVGKDGGWGEVLINISWENLGWLRTYVTCTKCFLKTFIVTFIKNWEKMFLGLLAKFKWRTEKKTPNNKIYDALELPQFTSVYPSKHIFNAFS